ncbi:MAG: tRNA preQ1(34) S-adenosylmethionine ribosyltransferase-isomerase QueA [Planctomycetota bacterium]
MPEPLVPFQYELPRELIAQEPLSNRVDARLMVIDRGRASIDHRHVRDLPDVVGAGDRLVLNNTRVVPAQLVGHRSDTGGRWQGLFLSADQESSGGGGHWRIVCKTRGKLKAGDSIVLTDRDGRDADKLWLLERLDAGQWLAHLDSDRPASDALPELGRVPLPHYIRGGQMVDADVEAYQTVFARRPGAVAAPTAGLHFTKPLLESLDHGGVQFSAVTLHVGLGTFRPIADGDVENHKMHAEWCELTQLAADEINQTRAESGRVIAVGTTCVRTLETAARESPGEPLRPFLGETDLFLKPPCDFHAVGGLMTNFHFPGTTLLLLVEAFMGRDLLAAAYEAAIAERYRFYSYGDAMLIL